MFQKLNKLNPLAAYKLDNITLEWGVMAQKTGLTVQTLIKISQYSSPDDVIKILSLKTYFAIRRKLGVDMLKWGRPDNNPTNRKYRLNTPRKRNLSKKRKKAIDITGQEEISIDLSSIINNK